MKFDPINVSCSFPVFMLIPLLSSRGQYLTDFRKWSSCCFLNVMLYEFLRIRITSSRGIELSWCTSGQFFFYLINATFELIMAYKVFSGAVKTSPFCPSWEKKTVKFFFSFRLMFTVSHKTFQEECKSIFKTCSTKYRLVQKTHIISHFKISANSF